MVKHAEDVKQISILVKRFFIQVISQYSYCTFCIYIYIYFQEALPEFKNVPYYEETEGFNLQRPHNIHCHETTAESRRANKHYF